MGIEEATLQISNGEGLEINVCPIAGSFSPILPIDSAIHRSCRPILSLCLRPLADLIGLARYVACTLKLWFHHGRDLELSGAMRLLWL